MVKTHLALLGALAIGFTVWGCEAPLAEVGSAAEIESDLEPEPEPVGPPPSVEIPDPDNPTEAQAPARDCVSASETLSAFSPTTTRREPGAVLEEWLHEGCPVTRTMRTFNSEGQVTSATFRILEFERLPLIYGSWVEYHQVNLFDDEGRLVSTSFDAGEGDPSIPNEGEPFDGVPEAVKTTTYDGDRVVRETTTGWFNSGYDVWLSGEQTVDNTYDASGRLIEQRTVQGAFASVTTQRFEGDVLVEISRFSESDGVRTLEEHVEHTLDDLDRVVATTTSRRGTVVKTSEVTFSDSGRVEVHEETFSANNVRRATLTFDRAGHEVRSEEDHPAGGPIERTVERTFNANGDVLVEETFDENGLIGRVVSTYDDDFRLLERRRELSPFSNIATFERSTYDEYGDLVRRELGQVDGALSSITEQTWVFDLAGARHMRSRVHDHDADGTADTRETWVYDAHGNLLGTRASSCQQDTFDFFGPCAGPLVDVTRLVYPELPEI